MTMTTTTMMMILNWNYNTFLCLSKSSICGSLRCLTKFAIGGLSVYIPNQGEKQTLALVPSNNLYLNLKSSTKRFKSASQET